MEIIEKKSVKIIQKTDPQTNYVFFFFVNSKISLLCKIEERNWRRESNFLVPPSQVVAPPLAGEIIIHIFHLLLSLRCSEPSNDESKKILSDPNVDHKDFAVKSYADLKNRPTVQGTPATGRNGGWCASFWPRVTKIASSSFDGERDWYKETTRIEAYWNLEDSNLQNFLPLRCSGTLTGRTGLRSHVPSPCFCCTVL